MAIRYPITLSTTEPNNNIGLLKIRQADEETQTLVVQILEDSIPKSYEGLQVFFCARIGQSIGLGIIEQKLNETEMTDPNNGKLEYTFRAEDWQILGRQLGYFSFRKMKDDHTYEQQFSTRDFIFEVTPNIYSDGIKELKRDGSTYIWTIEDLLRLFNEYIATGKTDWKEFVDQNREILEAVDPGGVILTELIDSRKNFPTLSERLEDNDVQREELKEAQGELAAFRPFDNTIIEKLANEAHERLINVKWFGAKGDGTTNDSPAIKAAYDYVKSMINTFSKNPGLYFPPGTYRVINPLVLDEPRIAVKGAGFGSIITADTGVPAIFNLAVPRPKSSTIVMSDLMLMGADALISSEQESVDILINHMWFGSSKYHIKGSFITFNLNSCILEMAKEASIYSESAGGFRKVNISACNFYGNSKYHINIVGDNAFERCHTINVSSNTFDQANPDIADNTTSGMIRMANCRDFTFKGNTFNGLGTQPGNGIFTLLNCKNFEIDSHLTNGKGTNVTASNCHSFKLRGIQSMSEKAILASNCNNFDIDTTVTEMSDDAITITNCDNFSIAGRVKTCQKNGIVVNGSRDGRIDADVTDCNRSATTTGAGVSLKVSSGNATKRTFIQNNRISGNATYNIRVETGCLDNVLNNINMGLDTTTKLLDVGTNTVKKDLYSFTG